MIKSILSIKQVNTEPIKKVQGIACKNSKPVLNSLLCASNIRTINNKIPIALRTIGIIKVNECPFTPKSRAFTLITDGICRLFHKIGIIKSIINTITYDFKVNFLHRENTRSILVGINIVSQRLS